MHYCNKVAYCNNTMSKFAAKAHNLDNNYYRGEVGVFLFSI